MIRVLIVDDDKLARKGLKNTMLKVFVLITKKKEHLLNIAILLIRLPIL